jgi:hypothetical protein
VRERYLMSSNTLGAMFQMPLAPEHPNFADARALK